jgi:hypothetical protein
MSHLSLLKAILTKQPTDVPPFLPFPKVAKYSEGAEVSYQRFRPLVKQYKDKEVPVSMVAPREGPYHIDGCPFEGGPGSWFLGCLAVQVTPKGPPEGLAYTSVSTSFAVLQGRTVLAIFDRSLAYYRWRYSVPFLTQSYFH